MVPRPLWLSRIDAAHRAAPIAWLTGVRRVGKTTLVSALSDALYVNCDLPSSEERLRDPERFLASLEQRLLVLDEVHQLPDPTRLLKIAADTFPAVRIVATGSSTLSATAKFRDTLTGRKRAVHLPPVLVEELPAFGIVNLERRLVRGGLPPALLAERPSPDFYGEWMDSFFARDIQELFRVEKRHAFLLLLRTLLRNSGGLAEVSNLARIVGVSRPTIGTWLEALELTHAICVLRPFHGGSASELTHQPKIYGFDTGFVAWEHGWQELRAAERGLLWEHLVLDTLRSLGGTTNVHFWRDKQRNEVDFVVPRGRGACDAFEVKWSVDAFESRGLRAMRALHPNGRNFLVAPIVGAPYDRTWGGETVRVLHAAHLRAELASDP